MTDVVTIAKERRADLASEIARIDDFIRMAEALVEWSQSNAGKAGDAEAEITSEPSENSTVRSYSAAAGAAAKK
jgi:hypothetical protein